LALIQNILSEELETKKNQMVELIARCWLLTPKKLKKNITELWKTSTKNIQLKSNLLKRWKLNKIITSIYSRLLSMKEKKSEICSLI
jgi:hypothetical protein